MTAPTPDDGEARRDAALDLLAEMRSRQVRLGQRALLRAVLDRGHATADDVRAEVALPAGIAPVCMGAVPRPLARASIIGRDGHVPSTRPEAHGRPTALWILLDRAAAERWLDEHPAPDDPGDAQRRLF